MVGSRKAIALCAALVAIGLGCSRSRGEQPRPAPEPPRVQPAPAPAAPSEPSEPAALNDTFAAQPAFPTAPGGNTLQPGATPGADEAPADVKPARDFSAELEQMLSGAKACVQPRASSVTLLVTAYVMGSGAVSRAEVNAADLELEERACVRARVQALRFAPPVENAPLSVSASLQITPNAAATAKEDAPKTDALGMIVTQAPSGEGVTPGVVPPEDPGVVPPEDKGVVPEPDPGVIVKPDPADIPPPEPAAEQAP